ncbi:PREDICTED: FIZZY-RELATED 2, partial [Prunus dulcis]
MFENALSKSLDKHCLEGHNFPKWFQNLKIVLINEKIAYVLDKLFPRQPPGNNVTERRN